MRSEQDEVNLLVADVFGRLRVPHFVGGSLASSTHGFYRATNDSDFIAFLPPAQATAFVALLDNQFYADVDTVRDAATRCSSFNITPRDDAESRRVRADSGCLS